MSPISYTTPSFKEVRPDTYKGWGGREKTKRGKYTETLLNKRGQPLLQKG